MVKPEAVERDTARDTMPTDSSTVDSALANDINGGSSTSMMVYVNSVVVPRAALTGSARVMITVSSSSSSPSLITSKGMFREVCPGLKVSCPGVREWSMSPPEAVPEYEYSTVTVRPDTVESSTAGETGEADSSSLRAA